MTTMHNKQPFNVLHVISGLPLEGAQVSLCKLIEQWPNDGVAPRVISLMKADGPVRDRIAAAGGTVEDLGLRRGQVSLKAAVRLIALARRDAPALIQGWEVHGSLAASIAVCGLRPRRPVVWGIHHSILELSSGKPATRGLIRLGAPLSGTTAAVVYCSKASARQHERIGYAARKTAVIPNGFDCEMFRPRPEASSSLRSELSIPCDRTIIGHVSRFDPVKDHGNLIAAAARLIVEAQDVHLVLIGPNLEPGNHELAASIRTAGIGARVSLLGERTDIATLMPGFDILALSSLSEAFPNVLGEAMASGVPCVATDVGDCSWIVGDTGIVVPPGDSGAFAAGLTQLVEVGQEARCRRGAAARARVVENFNLPDMARRYASLYERLLADSRTQPREDHATCRNQRSS